jgi:hypothetical protein
LVTIVSELPVLNHSSVVVRYSEEIGWRKPAPEFSRPSVRGSLHQVMLVGDDRTNDYDSSTHRPVYTLSCSMIISRCEIFCPEVADQVPSVAETLGILQVMPVFDRTRRTNRVYGSEPRTGTDTNLCCV